MRQRNALRHTTHILKKKFILDCPKTGKRRYSENSISLSVLFFFLRRDYRQKGDCVSPKLSHSTTRKQDKKQRDTHNFYYYTTSFRKIPLVTSLRLLRHARPNRDLIQPQAYKKRRRELLLLYFCTNMERLIDQQRTRFLFCTCAIFIQKRRRTES